MPTLEVQIEKANRDLAAAKEMYDKANPEKLSENSFKNRIELSPKNYPDGLKAYKELQIAQAKLRRLETKKYNRDEDKRISKRNAFKRKMLADDKKREEEKSILLPIARQTHKTVEDTKEH